MSQNRWIRCGALGIGVALAAALVAGCGGTGTDSGESAGPAGSATTSSAQPSGSAGITPAPGQTGPVEVPDPAAQKLCDLIAPQLSDWRVQGPTLGKVALNIAVHEWAATNGGINMAVLADKSVVDRITTQRCSDVRDQALEALQLPDLASGIAF